MEDFQLFIHEKLTSARSCHSVYTPSRVFVVVAIIAVVVTVNVVVVMAVVMVWW